LNLDGSTRKSLTTNIRGLIMLDLAALAALLVFFGLGALFVRGCDLI